MTDPKCSADNGFSHCRFHSFCAAAVFASGLLVHVTASVQRSAAMDASSVPHSEQVASETTATHAQNAGPESSTAKVSATNESTPSAIRKLNVPALPNAIQVHDKVISGGQPEGEKSFQALKDLGVRTIISVDGASPDLETARRFGLRYVHLPHSYDGVPEQRGLELARAVRDLDGPLYIHCHHGKHRSPAAAAVACVTAGMISPSNALTVLKTAGTNSAYRGLYQSATSAKRVDTRVLDQIPLSFPEIAALPPMAEAMVAVEHIFDRLKSAAAADWYSSTPMPDQDPAHEALLLKELFTEMLRTDVAAAEPSRFRDLLHESEAACDELETVLRRWQQGGKVSNTPLEAAKAFATISEHCTTCHREFRDIPLQEKNAAKHRQP